jgi:flagellar hook assembly protein FlgD
VEIDQVVGRDNANHDVPVQIAAQPLAVVDRVLQTELQPAVPNPVTSRATIAYSIATAGPVEVAIYGVDGRLVRTLAHGVRQPGRYQARWDGTDERGTPLRSGAYFVRLEAGAVRRVRLVTLMR